MIPTLSGAACHLDAEGGAWRAYDFVEDTICLQQVGSEADFRTVAETLGKFQNQLADYPASTLHETIARFHDTPNRYANFEKALAADALGRAKDIAPEVAFIHAREKDCHALLDLLAAGEIPLRVSFARIAPLPSMGCPREFTTLPRSASPTGTDMMCPVRFTVEPSLISSSEPSITAPTKSCSRFIAMHCTPFSNSSSSLSMHFSSPWIRTIPSPTVTTVPTSASWSFEL